MKSIILYLCLLFPIVISGQNTYTKIIDNNEDWLKNYDLLEKNDSTFYLINRGIVKINNSNIGSIDVKEIDKYGEILNSNSFTYQGTNHLFVADKNCSILSSDNKLLIGCERYDGTPIVLFLNEDLTLDSLVLIDLDPDFYLARNRNIIEVHDGFMMILSPAYEIDNATRPWLIKIDKTGNVLWKKRFLEGNIGEFAALRFYQYDDHIILFGGHSRPINNEIIQIRSWILSIDTDGEVLWEHFTDWGSNSFEQTENYISDLIKTEQGWIVTRTYSYYDPTSIPLRQNRLELWDNEFNPVWDLRLKELTAANNLTSILQVSDTEFIATGRYADDPYVLNYTLTAYAVKFNIEGIKIWERQDSILYDPLYGCKNYSSKSILTKDGTILQAGRTITEDSLGKENTHTFLINMDQNGCIEDNCPQIMTSINDIEILESINVNIAPNPSNGLFTVSSDKIINKVQVYTISGILIKTLINNNKQIEVDLSNYLNGTYFIRASIDQEIVVEKIIKM